MKILTLIFLLVFTSLVLKAADGSGFYIGGTAGYTLNSNIKVGSFNQQKSLHQTTIYEPCTETNPCRPTQGGNFTEFAIKNTSIDNYNSILKEINFQQTNAPILALSGGYTFKNLRFEGEIKTIFLKVKPKNYIYDISRTQDYENIIGVFCHQSGSFNNTCKPNGINNIDKWIYTTISGTNENNFNTMVIDSSFDTPFFSTDIDRELFVSNSNPLNANNYLGFMNIIYELPLSQSFSLFTGVGLGYGVAIIDMGNIIAKTQITYPAYQYKIGTYYSVDENIDITLNYSNINMIGSSKILSGNNFQSVDIGLRYNFFKRNPTFYDDYNYRKIFSLPIFKK
ncbi:MAG: hypothetical protein FWE18_01550 [Alphaproteobacteria bacterium]|nr:hypothetical protein [Alphaproteobacteria bacterium]